VSAGLAPLTVAAAGTGPASTAAAGAALAVRRAAGDDRQALADMLARCSRETRYRRFHGYVNVFPRRYLAEALSGSPVHVALVASAADGRIVALASCRGVFEGVAELGILVEDEWQRRGIGRRLLEEFVGYASRTGLRALQAQVLAEQSWLVGLLRGYGTCETRGTGAVLNVTLRLPGCLGCPCCPCCSCCPCCPAVVTNSRCASGAGRGFPGGLFPARRAARPER